MSDLPTQTQEEKSSTARRAMNIIAYPLTALVGSYYAWSDVRKNSYNNLLKSGTEKGGIFHAEYKIREDASQKLLDDGIKGEAYRVEKAAIDEAYSIASKQTAIDKGYTNIWKRFKSLHSNQKLETAITFATAAGVTLGIVLTVANSKSLLDRIVNLGRKQDDQTPAK